MKSLRGAVSRIETVEITAPTAAPEVKGSAYVKTIIACCDGKLALAVTAQINHPEYWLHRFEASAKWPRLLRG
jgi:hypothetical protein